MSFYVTSAMSKSQINKGRAFELQVAKEIRRSGVDKNARRRPLSGSEKMVKGRGDMITKIPFSIECKKQEQMKFWSWWEQAESQSKISQPPLLIHSANFRPIMATLKLTDFLNLLKELNDWKESYLSLRESFTSQQSVT